MSDARWGDPREYDARDPDDQWPRVYDPRDRDEHDPRNALMRDLDLPRGDERELVVDRDRVYELDGEDSLALAAVGAFRVVPEHDLDLPHDTLKNLHDQRLIELVDLGDSEHGLTLSPEGEICLTRTRWSEPASRRNSSTPASVAHGEIHHDSNLYATFRQEEAGLRDEYPDLEIRRVILEQDLKREYQEFLQEPNRGRSDSDGRPGRDENEVRDWAREHDLPYFDNQVHFPDYRIEYELDGRELHQDVELFTPHYRGAHAARGAKAGFRILAFAERILPRASDLWVQASLDYKQRLQQLFFPEGIAFDGNRFNRTAVTAPLFKYLAPSESADEKLVSRVGIEPERRGRRPKPECPRITGRSHVERGETW
jgi:hypothetical protein